jgi:hypothetical protein
MAVRLAALGLLAVALPARAVVQQTPAVQPIVSVWYRGVPAGTPRLDDLAAIRALGLRCVTWPSNHDAALATVRRLAETVGLAVIARPEPKPAANRQVTNVVGADGAIDLVVAGTTAVPPMATAWRAIAHGARVISFDSGQSEGSGLNTASGASAPWVKPAVAISRQVSANAELVGRLRPGPDVTIAPPIPAGLEVVLLDADKSWVLVATNTAATPLSATADLPKAVPYALWVSWIDGTNMGMLSRPSGPRWTFSIGPGAAKVYLIGKVQR